VIAVVLDEPVTGHYGGDLAGPVFRRVAEASLRYLGVTPSAGSAKLQGVTRAGDIADTTIAALRASAPQPAPVEPPAPLANPPADAVRVPDAAGMAMREAVRAITAAGLVPQIEGTGRLVRQTPAAGMPVAKGASVRLLFEPPS
jgi:cell division protein FtsI (penicillin-binding protein 3)